MNKQRWLFLLVALLACTLFVTSCDGDKTPPPETSENETESQESESAESNPGESESKPGESESKPTESESEPTEGESEPPHVCAGTEWKYVKNATCTEDGEKQLLCNCGKVVETVSIPMSHSVVKHEAKAATCLEIGWDAYVTCTKEGCDYSTKVEKPALEHALQTHEAKAPTCLVSGWDAYVTCTREGCDYSTKVEKLADHVYENDECIWCEKVYGSEGLLYTSNGDGTCVVTGLGSCMDTDVYIPHKMPNGDIVVSVAAGAFRGCTNLASVTVPKTVMRIGENAFYGCSSLSNITVPFVGEKKDGSGARHFGYLFGAYDYEANRTYVPASLRTVVITSGVSIAAYAFYDCRNISSVTVPPSVTNIGFWAFYGCYKLVEVYDLSEHVTLEKGDTSNGYVGYYALDVYTDASTPSKVWSDADGFAFYEDGDLCYLLGYSGNETELTLPASCNGKNYAIYQRAFYNCERLTSVTIPARVTSIDAYSFWGCEKLDAVTFAGNSQLTAIGFSAFYNCRNLSTVTIPTGVTQIGDSAFEYCYDLLEVYNLSSCIVVNKGEASNGYVGCYAIAIYTDALTPSKVWTNNSGFRFYEDENICYLVGYEGSVTNLTLPINCNGNSYAINQRAFLDAKNITSITIPDGVTNIGCSAFSGCESLASIMLADSVASIGDNAFYNCYKLASITIPASVMSIGDNAFYNCKKLSSVTFGESSQLTSIGDSAFSGCERLFWITIPDSVISIGKRAFYNCESLISVYYRGSESGWANISKGEYWDAFTGPYCVTYGHTDE